MEALRGDLDGPDDMGPETKEMMLHTGGDGDNTGVHFSRSTDGSTATSEGAKVEPVPEGGEFPSRVHPWGD